MNMSDELCYLLNEPVRQDFGVRITDDCSFPLLLEYFFPYSDTWTTLAIVYLWSLRKLAHYFAIGIILIFFLPAWLGNNSSLRFGSAYTSFAIANILGSCIVLPFIILEFVIPGTINQYITCCSFILSQIIGVKFEFRNSDILRNGDKGVIIMNHMSAMDSLVACSSVKIFGNWSVAVKKELKWFGTYGLAMRLVGVIFIDRKSKSAMNQLSTAATQLFAKTNKFKCVPYVAVIPYRDAARLIKIPRLILFPEGTRNNSKDGSLLPFKLGAFRIAAQNGVPIFPVVISRYYFIEGYHRFARGTVVLKALKPIHIKPDEDLVSVAAKTQNQMQEEFSVISQQVQNERQTKCNHVTKGVLCAVLAATMIYLVSKILVLAEYANCSNEYFKNKYS